MKIAQKYWRGNLQNMVYTANETKYHIDNEINENEIINR